MEGAVESTELWVLVQKFYRFSKVTNVIKQKRFQVLTTFVQRKKTVRVIFF